jgi:hypothetical protein
LRVSEVSAPSRAQRLHELASLIAPCDQAIETVEQLLHEVLAEQAARLKTA